MFPRERALVLVYGRIVPKFRAKKQTSLPRFTKTTSPFRDGTHHVQQRHTSWHTSFDDPPSEVGRD